MFASLLSALGFDLKRQLRHIVITAVLALIGGILLALAFGFGIAALYEWLKFRYGTLPALGILGGAWTVLGIVFLCIAFFRPDPRKRPVKVASPLHEPAAAIAQATEQAVDSATGLIREGSRQQVFGAVLVAILAGFIIGRRI